MEQISLNAAYEQYAANPREELLGEIMISGERLVRSLVYSINPQGSIDDLMQAGYMGLLKAVRRYDPGREASFSTFAYHWVMGEVRLEVRRERTFTRPLWLVRLQDEILQATDAFVGEHQRIPNTIELAELLNMDPAGIGEAMQGGTIPLEELDLDKIRNQQLESFRLPVEDKILLQQAIANLTDMQKAVVGAVFFRERSQEKVGEELDLSRSQVYRSLKQSLALLAQILH